MMQRILRQSKGLRKSNTESGERMIGQQCRYNGDDRDMEEREDVNKILFRISTKVDHNTVALPLP